MQSVGRLLNNPCFPIQTLLSLVRSENGKNIIFRDVDYVCRQLNALHTMLSALVTTPRVFFDATVVDPRSYR